MEHNLTRKIKSAFLVRSLSLSLSPLVSSFYS